MFRRREEGLKKKDLELQASLIRFSKFLQARRGARTRSLLTAPYLRRAMAVIILSR